MTTNRTTEPRWRPVRRRPGKALAPLLVLLALGVGPSVAGADEPSSAVIVPSAGLTLGGDRVVIHGADLSAASFVQVARGDHHSVGLASDGSLYAWGDNQYGQLGNGTVSPYAATPRAVDMSGSLRGATITHITAGGNYTAVLTDDGRVHTWGQNYHGQLGDGSDEHSTVPVAVDTSGALAGARVTEIAAGYSHMVALTSDGGVFTWGMNDAGQLGIGPGPADGTSPTPVAVSAVHFDGQEVERVAAAGRFSMAVAAGGRSFYSWGNNEDGQLGTGDRSDRDVPTSGKLDGLLTAHTVIGLAGGPTHAVALLAPGGKAYSWGKNDLGQLGDDSTVDATEPVRLHGTTTDETALGELAQVAASDFNGYAIDADGTTYAWGGNGGDQLGNGTEVDHEPRPTEVDRTGTLVGRTVVDVAASGMSVTVIDDVGQVHGWGWNHRGELGSGNRIETPRPVRQVTHVVHFGSATHPGADVVVDLAAGTVAATTPPHAGGDVGVLLRLVGNPVADG